MKREYIVIKPNREIHRCVFCNIGIIMLIVFGVSVRNETSIVQMYVCFGVPMFFLVAYVFFRMIYNQRYLISETEIIKYIGKNMVFKLQRENICELVYVKTKWYDWLLSPIFVFIPDVVSFRFMQTEFLDYYNLGTSGYYDTLSKEQRQSGLKEFTDYFSRRDLTRLEDRIKMIAKSVPMSDFKDYNNQ